MDALLSANAAFPSRVASLEKASASASREPPMLMDPSPVACAGRDARSCPRRGCVHTFMVSKFCKHIVIGGAGGVEPDESPLPSGRLERGPGERG
jgi:hypothetical protein